MTSVVAVALLATAVSSGASSSSDREPTPEEIAEFCANTRELHAAYSEIVTESDAISVGMAQVKDEIKLAGDIDDAERRKSARLAGKVARTAAKASRKASKMTTKLAGGVAACEGYAPQVPVTLRQARETPKSCREIGEEIKRISEELARAKAALERVEAAIEKATDFLANEAGFISWLFGYSSSIGKSLKGMHKSRDSLKESIAIMEAAIADLLAALEHCSLPQGDFEIGLNGQWMHNGPDDTTFFGCVTTTPEQPGASFVYDLTKPNGSTVHEEGTLASNGTAAIGTPITQYGTYEHDITITGPSGAVAQHAETEVTAAPGTGCA